MDNEIFNNELKKDEIAKKMQRYKELYGEEFVNSATKLSDNEVKNIEKVVTQQTTQPQPVAQQKTSENGVITNVVKGVTGGTIDAIGNVIDSVDMLSTWAADNITKSDTSMFKSPLSKASGVLKESAKYYKDDGSAVNKATHDITEFLVGFIPALKGVNALSKTATIAKGTAAVTVAAQKAATAIGTGSKVASATGAVVKALPSTAGVVAKGTAAGTVGAGLTVTPDTENMSNMIKNLGISTSVTDYLAIDPANDSKAEMKLKQVLDNALFGIVSDSVIEGIGLGIKAFKARKLADGVQPKEVATEFNLALTQADEVAQEQSQKVIQENEKEVVAEKLKQIEEFSKISENNPLMADYQKSLAAKENKSFIAEVLSKENPTDEEIDKLSKIFEDIDEQSIQSVDKMVEIKNYFKSEKDAGRNEIEALRAKRLNEIKAFEEEAKQFEDELKFFEANIPADKTVDNSIAKKQLEEKIAAKQEQILIAKDEAERFKEFANKEKLIQEIAKSDLLTKEEKRYFDNIISQEAEVAAKNADAEFAATKEMYNIAEETNFIEKNLNDYVRSNRAELSKGINDTLDNLKSKLSTVKVGKNTVVDNAIKDIKDVAKSLNVELDENVLRNAIETIKESDTKQITESLINSVEDTLKTATENKMRTSFKNQGGFASGQMLAQMGGAGIGAIGGAQTIDENDSNAEKIIKILGGAGAGIFGTAAVNRYVSKKMTKQQAEVFEKQNPTIAAVVKNDAIIKKEEVPFVKKLTPEEVAKEVNKSVVKQMPDIASKQSQEEIAELSDKFITGDYTKLTADDFEKEGVFQNFKYIESEEDIDKVLLQTFLSLNKSINKAKVGDLGNQLTGVRTWDQAAAKSEIMQSVKSVNDLFAKTDKLDVYMHAGRLALSNSGARIKKLGEEILELQRNAGVGMTGIYGDSTALKLKMIEYNNAMSIHRGIALKVTGSSSEIGRALNIHKLIIKQEQALSTDIDSIIAKIGGIKNVDKKVKLLQGLEHPAQMDTVIRMSNSKVANALLYARITGLLWNPFTQVVNITGNILNQGLIVTEKYTKAGYASINNAISKNKLDYTFKDANMYASSLIKGLNDGFSYVIKEKKFGEGFYKETAGTNRFNMKEISGTVGESGFVQQNPIGDLIDPEGNIKNALKYLGIADDKGTKALKVKRGFESVGSAVGANLRFMGAVDTMMQAVTFRASVAEQASRQARAEGLTDQAFIKRVDDLINDPPEELMIKAEQDGLAATFQTAIDKTQGKSFVDAMANIVQYGKSYSNSTSLSFVANVLVPFVKTPTNILKQTLQRVPGLNVLVERSGPGSLNALFGKLGKEAQAEAMARFTSGIVLIGAGLSMYESGLIKSEDNGKKIIIDWGGRATDVSRIEPFGTLIGYGAYVKQAVDKSNRLREADPEQANNIVQDIIAAMALSTMQYTSNKSYMKGALDFIELSNDVINGKATGERVGNFLTNQTLTFMPFGGAINYARNSIDDYKRETDGIVEKLINKIPLASESLDPTLDIITGEPILSDSTTGAFKKQVENKTLDELRRLDVRMDFPDKLKGIKLNSEQKNKIIKYATQESIFGMTLQEALQSQMESEEYQDMIDGVGDFQSSAGTKRKLLIEIIDTYYAQAEGMFIQEEEDFQDKLMLKEINKNNYLTNQPFLKTLGE